MLTRTLAKALFATTFLLLLLGGVVHTTGASLACPDWPLCHGEFFPPMQGGILYEHGHRLLASAVGLLALTLCVGVWNHQDKGLRILGLTGVGLVILQGALGGLTVVLRLPALVSIAHLATSMAFFAWTLGMVFRLRDVVADHFLVHRRGVLVAAVLVYVQLVGGAVVRHSGASLACGLDVFWCLDNLVPITRLQWIQTFHRSFGILVGLWVIAATLTPMKAARLQGRSLARFFGVAAHILVLAQIAVGLLTIKTAVQLHVVTTHLALGALLWADIVAFYLALGPAGAQSKPRRQPLAVSAPREFDGAC